MGILALKSLFYNGFAQPVQSGLITWLDASDSSTLTLDGSNGVSAWNTKTSYSTDFTQGTTASRPIYSTDHVDFDGTNDWLILTSSSDYVSDVQTTFIVCEPDVIATTVAARVILRSAYNTSNILTGFYNQNNLLYFHARTSGNTFRGNAISTASGSPYAVGKKVLLLGQWKADDTVLLTADETVNSALATGANNSPSTHTRTRLGANSNPTATDFFDGKVYEMLFYTRDLTDLEIRQNYNYLAHKWDLVY